MIVRPRPKFLELFFLLKGSILRRIALQLSVVFIFSLAMVVLEPIIARYHSLDVITVTIQGFRAAPFTLLGIAISIFLGFRNNACYDRWWEARRQLGQLVGEMRSFARFVLSTLPKPTRTIHTAIAFSYALTAHLRRQPLPDQVAQYITPHGLEILTSTPTRNLPDRLIRLMAVDYTRALQSGEITDILYAAFDQRLAAITSIQVACERISNTPTPFTYTLLLHRTAYLFCFLLPISLASTLGLATPFFCTLIAYTFFGLDALGDELEDPFGDHSNTLPLNALTRTIEINLLEALGEPDLPPYLEPIDHELR